MQLQLDTFGQYKNYIHIFQAVVLFLAWALTIAVLTRPGDNDGRVGWYFGLCWLTIPMLIYLTMVPMWSRARRFSNVYAFATLDGISVILWLSAWASTASYVAQGKSEGSDDSNNDTGDQKSGCHNFKYGSPGRCQLATGTTILGVFIMLGFIATSWFSFRALMEYKRTGIVPNQGLDDGNEANQNLDFQAQTQGDFDISMQKDDFDEMSSARYRTTQDYGYGGRGRYEEEYTPIHQQDHSEMHPQEPLSPLSPTPTVPYSANADYGRAQCFQDEPTGYRGVGGSR